MCGQTPTARVIAISDRRRARRGRRRRSWRSALDPRFDFSKAYWLVAGIAGVDPADASLGSRGVGGVDCRW
ncbi:MAG: hypothetical protein QM760_22115 [Nibricoccus sp.]